MLVHSLMVVLQSQRRRSLFWDRVLKYYRKTRPCVNNTFKWLCFCPVTFWESLKFYQKKKKRKALFPPDHLFSLKKKGFPRPSSMDKLPASSLDAKRAGKLSSHPRKQIFRERKKVAAGGVWEASGVCPPLKSLCSIWTIETIVCWQIESAKGPSLLVPFLYRNKTRLFRKVHGSFYIVNVTKTSHCKGWIGKVCYMRG